MIDDVAQIWADVLLVQQVSPDDDFFKRGGDSFTATMLVMQIEEQYGVLLDPAEVFITPVLKNFVQVLMQALDEGGDRGPAQGQDL